DGRALADGGVALDDGMRVQPHVGAQHHARAYDRPGTDLDAVSQPGRSIDDRRRVNCHSGVSTTMAANSASAASLPSTKASPRNLNRSPRWRTTSTGMRSTSPGRTGRRKRTPSTDMKKIVLPLTSAFRDLDIRTAPVWPRASTISTPGITGLPGKWPWKNGSLAVTFLIPTIDSCGR